MAIIQVLVIDDSKVVREIVKQIVDAEPDMQVIGEAADPYQARELIKQLNPDVLTLDVEMPKMDGITFLSNLMRLRPMPVVMLSTLTTKGADITLQALEIGAVDFVAKPNADALLGPKQEFAQTLIAKLRLAYSVDQKNLQLTNTLTSQASSDVLQFNGCQREQHILAIGASTGGTEAIRSILEVMPENAPAITITQHIPTAFSARFAQRLNEQCHMQVHEARHGQKIKQGHVYIAPGGRHLSISKRGGLLYCCLLDTAAVNRHKPSVEVMFDSLLSMADNVQAVLLTGMGQDGADAMLRLKREGAMTIIQDKASSAIWGMPGSAAKLGAHCKELALNDIAKHLLTHAALNHRQMTKALNS